MLDSEFECMRAEVASCKNVVFLLMMNVLGVMDRILGELRFGENNNVMIRKTELGFGGDAEEIRRRFEEMPKTLLASRMIRSHRDVEDSIKRLSRRVRSWEARHREYVEYHIEGREGDVVGSEMEVFAKSIWPKFSRCLKLLCDGETSEESRRQVLQKMCELIEGCRENLETGQRLLSIYVNKLRGEFGHAHELIEFVWENRMYSVPTSSMCVESMVNIVEEDVCGEVVGKAALPFHQLRMLLTISLRLLGIGDKEGLAALEHAGGLKTGRNGTAWSLLGLSRIVLVIKRLML